MDTMKFHSKHNQGFTLIELLISISLLSMIMLLASWSFSMFIDRWEGRLGNFSQSVSESKDFILLNNIISTTMPYLIEKENSLGYYFLLTERTVKAVSQNGIFHTTGPVYFKLSVEKNSNGEQYLLYQEGAVSEQLAFTQEVSYSHEKVLIDQSQSIVLQMLSWPSIIEKIQSEDPLINNNMTPQWVTEYDAWDSKLMPLVLRVIWDDSVLDITLTNDQGRWYNMVSTLKGITSDD